MLVLSNRCLCCSRNTEPSDTLYGQESTASIPEGQEVEVINSRESASNFFLFWMSSTCFQGIIHIVPGKVLVWAGDAQ